MLFRQIDDPKLAQYAYLIGCQRTGEAIVFDPERDVDRYVDAAAREGLRIVAVAETHIHADFLSGARELAERVGAHVYVGGQGGPEWQSKWVTGYGHTLLRIQETFFAPPAIAGLAPCVRNHPTLRQRILMIATVIYSANAVAVVIVVVLVGIKTSWLSSIGICSTTAP